MFDPSRGHMPVRPTERLKTPRKKTVCLANNKATQIGWLYCLGSFTGSFNISYYMDSAINHLV